MAPIPLPAPQSLLLPLSSQQQQQPYSDLTSSLTPTAIASSSSSHANIIKKEGWLSKQGNYIRNWRPRWVQIMHGCLYYYKEPANEKSPTNYFVLAGCRVVANDKLNNFAFELILANNDKRYLCATSAADRADWMMAIANEAASRKQSVALPSAPALKPAAVPAPGAGQLRTTTTTTTTTTTAAASTGIASVSRKNSNSSLNNLSGKSKQATIAASDADADGDGDGDGDGDADADADAADSSSSLPTLAVALQTPGFKLPTHPDAYAFQKVIGRGNYGKVVLSTVRDEYLKKVGIQSQSQHQSSPITPATTATLSSSNPFYFAVKIIKKSSLVDEDSVEHVLAENRILQSVSHPFLVRLYTSFQTADRLYFVMEYVCGGEIFFHISKEKRFTEERARLYIAEVLLALQHLHSRSIVYRDLKLENILLDADGHVKITDFGLCKEGIGRNDRTSTFCGTPEYLAPEILEDENYGKSVDWWALGVVLYEFLVGRPPFGSPVSVEALFEAILRAPIPMPEWLSPAAKSVLTGLLTRDHTRRLGSGAEDGREIMRHPFFESVDWEALFFRNVVMPFKPRIASPSDTDNFDPEFTSMLPQLTPSESTADDLAIAGSVTGDSR